MNQASQKLDPIVGSLFARRFLVDSLFAYGGMGTVYHASDTKTGRAIALKVLRAEYNSDPITVQRFLREAEMVGCIHHPHVVELVDSGVTDEGLHYIATEFLSGRSLDAILSECKYVQPDLAVEYAIQAADGLIASHTLGIVHRDLKPANLFIVQTPNTPDFVKIIDFGIARKVTDHEEIEASKLTSVGMTVGTPYYMSPEQIKADDVDGRADIYSLAIILWECLYGAPPYTGQMMEVFHGHVEEKIPKLPEKFKVVPLYVEAYKVLTKALAKNRNKRYQTMQEFQRALENVLRKTGSPFGNRMKQEKGAMPTKDTLKAYPLSGNMHFYIKIAIAVILVCVILGIVVYIVSYNIGNQQTPTDQEQKVSAFHTYKFQSYPTNAQVIVNGHLLGSTPTMLDLDYSLPFDVTFRLPGYPDYNATMDVTSGDIQGIFINFAEDDEKKDEKNVFYIETNPADAYVSVDGKLLPSSSPCDYSDPPQKFEVEVEKKGYKTELFEIFTVNSTGGSIRFKTTLVPDNKKLDR